MFALCQQRLPGDWLERFGHPLLLLLLFETFVGLPRFHGTVYCAAHLTCVGLTQGFGRTAGGYSVQPQTPEQVFVRALPDCFGAVSVSPPRPGQAPPDQRGAGHCRGGHPVWQARL